MAEMPSVGHSLCFMIRIRISFMCQWNMATRGMMHYNTFLLTVTALKSIMHWDQHLFWCLMCYLYYIMFCNSEHSLKCILTGITKHNVLYIKITMHKNTILMHYICRFPCIYEYVYETRTDRVVAHRCVVWSDGWCVRSRWCL